MKAFAALIERLEGTPDEDAAAAVLAHYLARTPDPDRGRALSALLGQAPRHRISRAALAGLAEARLDPVLLAICRQAVGDMAETVGLMWSPPQGAGFTHPPSVAEVVAALDRPSSPVLIGQLARWLDALEPSARVALLRMATGQLAAAPLPCPVAQAAVARMRGAPVAEVEELWHASAPPHEALLAWAADRGPPPRLAAIAPFTRLAPVRRCPPGDRPSLDLAAHAVDYAWDGLRVLAVVSGRTRRLYTRRGESVEGRFFELLDALSIEGAFEGMLVMRDAAGRCSRAALEARLAPARRPGGRTHAPHLVVHDILTHEGEDLRPLPLRERRARLARLGNVLQHERVTISALLPAEDLTAVESLRAQARACGAAGVVFKSLDAPYGEQPWVEWPCDSLTLLAVLLYVEHGLDGATATVGVWNRTELVPVAKVPLAEAECAAAILGFAAETRLDRFGPVQQVAAGAERGLVLEIGFSAVEGAPRRKSGVALRDACLLRVLDVEPSGAAQLEDVRALIS